MSLRDALLEERKKILAELESVENMLRVRCGWSPGEDSSFLLEREKARKFKLAVAPSSEGPSSAAIHYSNEFRAWLNQYQKAFTVADFRNYLASKYGADAVNDNSVRSPLNLAEEQGEIVVVEKGAGRRPTVFKSSKLEIADDEV